MTATLIQSPDRVVLPHVSWQTYQSLVKDFEREPALRLTYDRGRLEIRMPLDPHEAYKKLLGRLVEALTEELSIEIRSLGSRTCDREDLTRGLEPDQCYYIQNEPAVWDKEQIDLSIDPPPRSGNRNRHYQQFDRSNGYLCQSGGAGNLALRRKIARLILFG